MLADHDKGNTLLAVSADGVGAESFAISADGEFAMPLISTTVFHSLTGKISQLDLATATESLVIDLGNDASIGNLSFSPDGKRLAFTDYGTLYTMDPASKQTDQVYTGARSSYMGGLQAYCEIQHLLWVDESHFIYYTGHTLPDAIAGDSKRRTVSCGDRTWCAATVGAGTPQQVDRISRFSAPFNRGLRIARTHLAWVSSP
ncbi:MAG: PD40 domain-containing protein [Anaerolineales bacterium]|nr:PD40 domain-containing protein [Anaerolineales bacterium]